MNETTRKYFTETHMVREEEHIEFLIEKCESPIEELFVTAFYSCKAEDELELGLYMTCREFATIKTDQQKKIGRYRADFVVEIQWKSGDKSLYAVELDGHEFHEKTKEQVKKRNERDRFFVANGIQVIHFSGSEVVNDPDVCVDTAIHFIADCESERRKKEGARSVNREERLDKTVQADA